MFTSKQQQYFKVIVEQDEDGFFVAQVPALPGCVTQAKTQQQLTKRVQEAIQLCLKVAKTDPDYRKQIEWFAYEPTFVGIQNVAIAV